MLACDCRASAGLHKGYYSLGFKACGAVGLWVLDLAVLGAIAQNIFGRVTVAEFSTDPVG